MVLRPQESEDQETVVAAHRRKKPKGKRADELSKFPVVQEHHYPPAEKCECSHCHKLMKDIGGTLARNELCELDVLFKLIQHIQHGYVCENCKNRGIRTEIIKAPVP